VFVESNPLALLIENMLAYMIQINDGRDTCGTGDSFIQHCYNRCYSVPQDPQQQYKDGYIAWWYGNYCHSPSSFTYRT
jgi:hypothetical protein